VWNNGIPLESGLRVTHLANLYTLQTQGYLFAADSMRVCSFTSTQRAPENAV